MTGAEPNTGPTYGFHGPTAISCGPNSVQNNYFALRFPDQVETQAQRLGDVVLAQWLRESALRGVRGAESIPVRWRERPDGRFGDHPDPSALPGALPVAGPGAVPVAGNAADPGAFADAFLRLGQRRLVVLGGPGSGKSTMAVLLVVELLRRMREGDPVPVLLPLASWRPRVEHLEAWLERQLLREYPYLSAGTVRLLRQGGRILPVLDGLDELPADERPLALEWLNTLEVGNPLVLTCRTEDYAAAVDRAEVLRSATVVEAEPLTAGEASAYLLGSATPQHQERWRPLAAALTADPDGPAARALTVPLMLWLCRTAYRRPDPGRRPEELAERWRLPTPEAVEGHLLDSLVPSVYPVGPLPPPQPGRRAAGRWSREERNRDPERVSRWLGFLARHLERRRGPGLAWWELGTSVRPVPRVLLVGLAAGVFVTLLNGAVSWLEHGFAVAMLDGLINGIPAAVTFGLLHGIGFASRGAAPEPSRVRIRLRERAGQARARSGREILARAGAALVAGLVGGAALGLMEGVGNVMRSGNVSYLKAGLVAAVYYGLIFALSGVSTAVLIAWLEAPVTIASAPEPRDLLGLNRRAVLLLGLVYVPVFGCLVSVGRLLVIGLLHHGLWGVRMVWDDETAVRAGVLSTLGIGIGALFSLSAWGQWILFARFWLPLTGRLPRATLTFLEEAHGRGVLRKDGAVYRFRHDRLQQHLARSAGRRRH
ncbi:NACHT domain-containing protein [Kitasatospora sp. NPDC056651]|uniref:NACHT domain-containing protein n=1 Tax=Kitasatospora sp. NPDC056651 TaxID=3345892 RepID=UPI003687039F